MEISDNTLALAKQLGQLLQQQGWTISCAESCTGGGIGYAITSTSGSSAWFRQGIISYSNEAKMVLLGVKEQSLIDDGAVSQAVVEQMAQGAASKADAQVAISVSGVAGPDGGSADKPVGTVWFGFYVDGILYSSCQWFDGDRHQIRCQAIHFALSEVLSLLRK